MAAASPPSNRLQTMLQTAVQSVGWTYTVFWQLCPQQGILVWGDGYYNGAIKTRKTVQPMEVSTEEASLQRSEQLRELYDSLASGETNQPVPRRPSAALSPEDLTESEWFYLMCVSFSFPPGVGLPGKAYAKKKHVWLTGASDVDSKVFSRAILAKSAHVQTVVCIPLLDGVVELGTTKKVQEEIGFVERAKSFFIDHINRSFPPKPALSGHSTSSPAMSPPSTMMPPIYTPIMVSMDDEEREEEEDHNDDHINEEDGEDELEEDEEEEEEEESDTEAETGHDSRFSSVQNLQEMAEDANNADHDHALVVHHHEPSELMHHDLSEGIRFGSPDDGPNNLDSDFHMLAVRQAEDFASEQFQGRVDSIMAESTPSWPVQELQQDYNPFSNTLIQLQAPEAPQPEELTQEDTHYSHTVSTILHHQSSRLPDTSTATGYAIYSTQSAFAKWTSPDSHSVLHHHLRGPSQWVLKYVLFTVPYLHTSPKSRDAAAAESAARFRKGDELSANHVLAERRRREKLNERFIILRSLVPFVTKMDKASILGDTIEYLKQLRKKIQDLEARAPARGVETEQRRPISSSTDKRKMRKVEGDHGAGKPRATDLGPPSAEEAGQVEVSIIESDALVEMRCPYREGLLLDVMQVLRELRMEITTVQSSLFGAVFTTEMRAKVKENGNGRKLSIMEVERAINQIMPLFSN